MRTFIAIDIPEHVRQQVGRFEDGLKDTLHGVKWVAPENLHLTLKFLGEVPEPDIGAIIDCIDGMVSRFQSFTVELSHLGFFPAPAQPRVIWIGASSGVDHLLELYQDLEDCMEVVGVDRESKTFSPHLTIGRVRRQTRVTVPPGLPEFEETSFTVTGLSLVKSTLTPEGPLYERLHEASFSQLSYQEQ